MRNTSRGCFTSAAVVALLAAAMVTVQAVRSHLIWSGLRSAEASFQPSDAFTEVDRLELGTTWCAISCDGARIEVTYATSIEEPVYGDSKICKALEPAVRRLGITEPDLSPPPWTAGCLYADLPDVPGPAVVQVMNWGPCREDDTRACVRVYFWSGIS
jgi:hypothetical protein